MSEIEHSGIKGMKWGVRRFQNEDGSLTAAGKERYGSTDKKELKKQAKEEKREQIKKNVAEASKSFEKWQTEKAKSNLASNEADEMFKWIQNTYFERIQDANIAVDAYLKKQQKASELSDKAHNLKKEYRAAYKKTGKTAITRMINNSKYDPDKK